MKRLLFFYLLPLMLFATYHASISPITSAIKTRMLRGGSWHPGCPVHYHDLRYLQMTYIDFEGRERRGEMIVHKQVAQEVVTIFAKLYRIGYPIRQMHLVSDFGGSDWQSIEADNSSAFNCRNATGSRKWSKHSYGRAIDLNPLENPYVSHRGHISHKASYRFRQRLHRTTSSEDRAVLLGSDPVVKIFESYGWGWGGRWRTLKDYQHFSK